MINDLDAYVNAFDGMTPFSGPSEEGFLHDFMGMRTDASFREIWGDKALPPGTPITTEFPQIAADDGWFEVVNWAEAAREARDRYVMVTLGAAYGNQAVGAWKTLQQLNPMPAKLVAVEGDPLNIDWLKRHFVNNGLDPDDHWIVEAALGTSNAPILFPSGSPGCGAQTCVTTNSEEWRMQVIKEVMDQKLEQAVMASLLLKASTGVKINLAPGTEYDFMAEVRYVSAVTLRDVVSPFERVDFIEGDLQGTEDLVFPPAMALLSKKVRRIHLGTHGRDVHRRLHALFHAWGWEIIFSYEPVNRFETKWGVLETNDGILSVLNPRLAPGAYYGND